MKTKFEIIAQAVQVYSDKCKSGITIYLADHGFTNDSHIKIYWKTKQVGIFKHYGSDETIYSDLTNGKVYIMTLDQMLKSINEFRERINKLETFA